MNPNSDTNLNGFDLSQGHSCMRMQTLLPNWMKLFMLPQTADLFSLMLKLFHAVNIKERENRSLEILFLKTTSLALAWVQTLKIPFLL